MAFTYKGKTYSSVSSYNKSQGSGSGAASVRSTPVSQPGQPSAQSQTIQPVLEQPRATAQVPQVSQPSSNTQASAFQSLYGTSGIKNLGFPTGKKETLSPTQYEPNISYQSGDRYGVGYATPSGDIVPLTPVGINKTPKSIRDISTSTREYTRETPQGTELVTETTTQREITPQFIYAQSDNIIPRAPPATAMENIFGRVQRGTRDISLDIKERVRALPGDRLERAISAFGGRVYTESGQMVNPLITDPFIKDPSAGAKSAISFIARYPFETVSSIASTGRATTALFTGRPVTGAEAVDIGLTGITGVFGGVLGVRAGSFSRPLSETIKPLISSGTSKLLLATGGAFAAYQVATSPDKEEALLKVSADITKQTFVFGAAYGGAKATSSLLTRFRFPISETPTGITGSKGDIIRSRDLSYIFREPSKETPIRSGAIDIRGDRILKNLLGQTARERTMGVVKLRGELIGDNIQFRESGKVQFTRSLLGETGRPPILARQLSLIDTSTLVEPLGNLAEFKTIGYQATKVFGTKGIFQRSIDAEGILTKDFSKGGEIVVGYRDAVTLETRPSVITRFYDVGTKGTIYSSPTTYYPKGKLPEFGKSLFSPGELEAQTYKINFNPKSVIGTSTGIGTMKEVQDLTRDVTSLDIKMSTVQSKSNQGYVLIKKFTTIPVGKRGQTLFGFGNKGETGIETGFEGIGTDVRTGVGTGLRTGISTNFVFPTPIMTTGVSTITSTVPVGGIFALPISTGSFGSLLQNFGRLNIPTSSSNSIIQSSINSVSSLIQPATQTVPGLLSIPQTLTQVTGRATTQTLITPLIQPITGIGFPGGGITEVPFVPPIIPAIGFPYSLEFPQRRGIPSGFGKLFSGFTPNLRGLSVGRVERLGQVQLSNIRFTGIEKRGISTDVARILGIKPRRPKRRKR